MTALIDALFFILDAFFCRHDKAENPFAFWQALAVRSFVCEVISGGIFVLIVTAPMPDVGIFSPIVWKIHLISGLIFFVLTIYFCMRGCRAVWRLYHQ